MEILVPLAFIVAFALQAGEQAYRVWLKWKGEDTAIGREKQNKKSFEKS